MKKKRIVFLIIVALCSALFLFSPFILSFFVMQCSDYPLFPAQTDWKSVYPEHRGRAFEEYYDVLAVGTFRLVATEVIDGEERSLEIHQKDGMMMSTFAEGRMILRDGKSYTFLDALDGFYFMFNSPAPPWNPADSSHGISFVGWGLGEFDGRELSYERYEFESGNIEQFFFNGGTLVGFRQFSVLLDRITDTIIHTLDNNVSPETFEIPAGYQEFDVELHGHLVDLEAILEEMDG